MGDWGRNRESEGERGREGFDVNGWLDGHRLQSESRTRLLSFISSSHDGTHPTPSPIVLNLKSPQHGVKRTRESLAARRQRESAKLSAYLTLTDDVLSRACYFSSCIRSSSNLSLEKE